MAYTREFTEDEKKAYSDDKQPGYPTLKEWITYVVESQITEFVKRYNLKKKKVTTDPKYQALNEKNQAVIDAAIAAKLDEQNNLQG